LNIIRINDEDQKRINTIVRLWDFFGPSPQNMGAGDNTLSNYLNFNLLVSLGTEVGPYLPVIYPEML
jgi:hypothetical protein